MLLGMIHPTSGTDSIFGHRIDKENESLLIRQKVAFVAEDKRLYDYMTVAQIVRFTKSFFPNWNHSLERQLLEQFDLPPERRIRQLSKGMRTKIDSKIQLLTGLLPWSDLAICLLASFCLLLRLAWLSAHAISKAFPVIAGPSNLFNTLTPWNRR